jgi:hypothetical protein
VLIQDFNLCTPVGTTVLELAEIIWEKIYGSSKQFRYVSDSACEYQDGAPIRMEVRHRRFRRT